MAIVKERLARVANLPRPWATETTAQVAEIRSAGRSAHRAKRQAARKWKDDRWTTVADKGGDARERGDFREMHIHVQQMETISFRPAFTRWQRSSEQPGSAVES